jgi:purine-nucleoside phosphorylase
VTVFGEFRAAAEAVKPRTAVVLGSGLAGVAADFAPTATLSYADIPGLTSPSVAGHRGELAVGHWAGVPAVVCFGRVHFYEGHPWERVTRLVELAADLGVSRLILTNAAGGLHPDLNPGDVMLIAGQVELLGPRDWLTLTEPRRLYDPELLATLRVAAAGAVGGTYAGLTGPCYETPAEIRALAACGVDAVGMSTVREAAAGMARGLRVAGLTCVTNKAAGLAAGTLHHAEVEATARRAAGRMATLIAAVV